MSLRIILSFIISVAVAFGVIVVRQNMAPDEEVVVEDAAPVIRVLVATRDVAQGNFIQEGDVDWKIISTEEQQNPTHIYDSNSEKKEFNGAVVRRLLRANEPVPRNSLTKAGDGGFLSAVLEPGMRAVSISVTATSGNAGFISPGDRVDLILAHRVRGTGGLPDKVASETFISNCRVVAIDQMLDNPENKAVLAKTVTVEVTPAEAARLAVATEMGKISIALRSLTNDDSTSNKDAEFMRDSDISTLLDPGGNGMRVQVIRGDDNEHIDFNRGRN